ncbi:hypothetical protein LKV59_004049 [Salmonella enterica]|nr:hypothetical protein [Salmonella enterica]EIL6870965.1 hypothetical protein [Salmonella enterica]
MESMAEGMIKDLVASGHALADDMTGAPSVLIRCLAAQLEVQLVRANALAAENVGLKAAIDSTIGWQQSTDPVNVESVRMLVDIETPATDAFLAEVRAQGVEMFADKYRAQLTALPTTPENIFDADEFAAQLRKGGAS